MRASACVHVSACVGVCMLWVCACCGCACCGCVRVVGVVRVSKCQCLCWCVRIGAGV